MTPPSNLKRPSRMALLAAFGSVVGAKCSSSDAYHCPPLDSIGHAASQVWYISNLNWTLTYTKEGGMSPLPAGDQDRARVSFDLFHADLGYAEGVAGGGQVTCSAEGAEFGQYYTQQVPAGTDAVYNWYNCSAASGPSSDVLTQFQLQWYQGGGNVYIQQTWTCDPADGSSSYPMRASGGGQFAPFPLTCVKNSTTNAETSCTWPEFDVPVVGIEATVVEVLPPPPTNCAAASQASPNWIVSGFKWVTETTPFSVLENEGPASDNMTFFLINQALNYSTRMDCTQGSLDEYEVIQVRTPYSCNVFEANPQDVPPTKYGWIDQNTTLTIDQTWSCDDPSNPGSKVQFHSIGLMDVSPYLNCSTAVADVDEYGMTTKGNATTCVATSDFELKGKLQ